MSSIFETVLGWFAGLRLPKYTEDLKISGINDKIEIIRDKYAIPHIYTSNEEDLLFAQGFVHAQERGFQIEVLRRVAKGQLAELFPEALLSDRLSRTMGFHLRGIRDVQKLDKNSLKNLTAYCNGINYYFEAYPRPIEFVTIQHTPGKWVPEDTLTLIRFVAFLMNRGWFIKYVNLALAEKLPESSQFNHHRFPYHIKDMSINLKSLFEIAESVPQEQGSNAWAISGELTGGAPLLASDPHLAVAIPSIWFEQHLICKEFNVVGVGIPGMPYISIGHNDKIAWGITLSFADVCDLFVEKIKDGKQYKCGEEWKNIEFRKEVIHIKGKEDHIENVRVTHHGPIVSQVVDAHLKFESTTEFSFSSPYVFEEFGPDYDALSGIVRSKNWAEFSNNVQNLQTYSLNFTYADVDGNIGYHLSGRIPKRTHESIKLSNYPVPGFDLSCEWGTFVPPEELPNSLNPKQGFLVSANHNIIDPNSGYQHFLGNCWKSGQRADRIAKLIKEIHQKNGKVTLQDCKNIQLDHHDDHKDIQNYVKKFGMNLDKMYHDQKVTLYSLDHVKSFYDEFMKWNGSYSVESLGATISIVFTDVCLKRLLKPKIGIDLTHLVMGCGLVNGALNEFHSHDVDLLIKMLKDPNDAFCALIDTITKIRHVLSLNTSPDPSEISKYTYGSIHKLNFNHLFGTKLSSFNRGGFPIEGSASTPNNMSHFPKDNFNVCVFPSYRMVVDLGDLDQSYSIFAPGQSGHHSSPHYDDFIKPYVEGKYKPMYWSQDIIQENSQGTINMTTKLGEGMEK